MRKFKQGHLEQFSVIVRRDILRMAYLGQTGHIGSCLSVVDILTAILWGPMRAVEDFTNQDRDKLILSKGHAVAALYGALGNSGAFPAEWFDTFNQNGTILTEQPIPWAVPGVDAALGSLGHGLPIGCGMALGNKLQNKKHRIWVVMSDGECNEGSVWEAAMFAASRNLSNLTVVIDYNKLQACGDSREILGLEPFVDKWRAFGWNVYECDGHQPGLMADYMDKLVNAPVRCHVIKPGKPTVIIAHTVKGKGVSFMENNNNWHYRKLSLEDFDRALVEIGI